MVGRIKIKLWYLPYSLYFEIIFIFLADRRIRVSHIGNLAGFG
jgi:hypothetical protein